MQPLLDLIKRSKAVIAAVIFVVAAAGFYVKAEDTFKKVAKHDKVIDDIAQLVLNLQDKNIWLRDYLVNHYVDSVQAWEWYKFKKGTPEDSSGVALDNIPYLDKVKLPEMGVLYMYIRGKETLIDTLWVFPREEKNDK